MTANLSLPTLSQLAYVPYLNAAGWIPAEMDGQIGVYAIFNDPQQLQYVGYSRDIALSLKQHLMRQPQGCYWFKVQTIDKPQRSLLEAMQAAWIAENGTMPSGNAEQAAQWTQPIDAKLRMTAAEQTQFSQSDGGDRIKVLKNVARRVEAEVKAALDRRGVQMDLRFNPKLKEDGLLDLK